MERRTRGRPPAMIRAIPHLADPARLDVYLVHDGRYVTGPGHVAVGVSTLEPVRLGADRADADLAAYRMAYFVRHVAEKAAASGRRVDPILLATRPFPS